MKVGVVGVVVESHRDWVGQVGGGGGCCERRMDRVGEVTGTPSSNALLKYLSVVRGGCGVALPNILVLAMASTRDCQSNLPAMAYASMVLTVSTT